MYGDCHVMQQKQMMMMGGDGSMQQGSMAPISIPDAMFFPFPDNHHHQLSSFISGMAPPHSFHPKDGTRMEGGEEPSADESSRQTLLQQEREEEGGDDDDDEAEKKTKTAAAAKKKKSKRYHRHTTHQIEEMEALYKECPHPDDKQRMRLSQELGLTPQQVKFWFQNRRTQMKAQQDRSDNMILRAENEGLKNDNFRLQSAIRNLVCTNCGGAGVGAAAAAILGDSISFDDQHLGLENARLKAELDRLSCMSPPSLDLDMGAYSRYLNLPISDGMVVSLPPPPLMLQHSHQTPSSHHPNHAPHEFSVEAIRDLDTPFVLELAVSAMEELVQLCRTNKPLWVRNGGSCCGGETLDLAEHGRRFGSSTPWSKEEEEIEKKEERRLEGSRDGGHVIMNTNSLVNSFFDMNKWMDLFPSIVSNARTLQVITPGVSGHGSLHLMYAELQVLTPLLATRETCFFRYCQQNLDHGFWTIVDFPADGFQLQGFDQMKNLSSSGYRRRPSGFIFQELPNGYSLVTWVEQAEVPEENLKEIHPIFDRYVSSGMAFGASRWLSVLQHQSNRLASLMARNVLDLGVIPSLDARKNLMMLSQRMIRTFCCNISLSSGSTTQPWTVLSDSSNDTIRISMRKNTMPGQPPNGVILTAVSTTWLPFSHLQVFQLLTDEHRRTQIDAISGGSSLHEVAHIANGSHQKNCVSLFRINQPGNSSSALSSQSVELLLQESTTHPIGGSLVVYTTIDFDAVQIAMSGQDPSYIPLIPAGFVMLPAEAPPTTSGTNTTTGCLLTVGFQVATATVASGKLNLSSITAINDHVCNAVDQISSALSCSNTITTATAASISDH